MTEKLEEYSPTARCTNPECRSWHTSVRYIRRQKHTRHHICLVCGNLFSTLMRDRPDWIAADMFAKPARQMKRVTFRGTMCSKASIANSLGLTRYILKRLLEQHDQDADAVERALVKERNPEPITFVAADSVRHYPWLIRHKKYSILTSGALRQIGAPFRLYGENATRPATAAVFHCGQCGGHAVMLLTNVKDGAEKCRTCSHTIHGMARNGQMKTYKLWKHLLTRQKAKEPVECSWLNAVTGVTALVADIGECPGNDYFLCRRKEASGWIRGNVYWRRDMPGLWRITADDSWHLQSGHLTQVGATIRLCEKPAVFLCHLCNRHAIESRSAVLKFQFDRCTDCRNADAGIEWRGERLSVVEWSARTGIPAAVLYDRVRNGWDAERMLTTPPRPPRGLHAKQTSDPIQDT